MEEIKEIEDDHAHEGFLLARERFKNLVFRYRVMNKIQRLKEFNKESYDYLKASLEV